MKYFRYFEKSGKHIIPYTALILPQFWEYCWISTKVYHIGNFLVFLANFFYPNALWLYQHFYLLQQNEVAVNEIIVLETVLSVNRRLPINKGFCRCHIVSAVEILTYLISRSQLKRISTKITKLSKSFCFSETLKKTLNLYLQYSVFRFWTNLSFVIRLNKNNLLN